MWSGWGVRTLSAAHIAYNPLSYQLANARPSWGSSPRRHSS
jgi:glycogen debranching enzyme